MINEFQTSKLQHLFRIIDFDHNGLIQKVKLWGDCWQHSHFYRIIEDHEKDARLRDEAHKIWEYLKVDFADENLQYLDMDQWLNFMTAHFYQTDKDKTDQNILAVVKRIHEVFDKNSDVQISRLEFMSIFVSFRVEVRFTDKCFKAIDSNSDGFISKQELINAAMEFFKSTEPEASGNYLFGQLESSHFETRRTLTKPPARGPFPSYQIPSWPGPPDHQR